MKNIFTLFILLSLFSCETTQKTSSNTMRNPKCEEVKSFKVFQVLDNIVLAKVPDEDGYYYGHVVCIPKEPDKIYYDDQIIKVKKNECAIYIDTYKYETKNGFKTVPIVKIINSQIPKTE